MTRGKLDQILGLSYRLVCDADADIDLGRATCGCVSGKRGLVQRKFLLSATCSFTTRCLSRKEVSSFSYLFLQNPLSFEKAFEMVSMKVCWSDQLSFDGSMLRVMSWANPNNSLVWTKLQIYISITQYLPFWLRDWHVLGQNLGFNTVFVFVRKYSKKTKKVIK